MHAKATKLSSLGLCFYDLCLLFSVGACCCTFLNFCWLGVDLSIYMYHAQLIMQLQAVYPCFATMQVPSIEAL